jgi:hypothetical protein
MSRGSYSSYAYAPYAPATPPRSPKTSTSPAMSSSPTRKVVTDFATFGAPANASVFGTAVASSPFSLAGGKAAFGGIRGTGREMFDDDDDDDDDNSRQKVELKEDSITLDQARRIAMQSAWRGTRA